jgi:hypothetical protein
MGFPYTKKMDSIGVFLKHIADDGKPTKVDLAHLQTLGLTSSNDRPLVPLAKALGFVNPDGSPSDRWSEYRDKERAKAVLAKGIKEAYPEFFATYPDAHRKDNEAIRNIVKAKTDLGQSAADLVVRTFKTLVSQADFEGMDDLPEDNPDGSGDSGRRESGGKVEIESPRTPTIAINIQLALPPDADDETYEKLFAALSKHLPL